MLNRRLFLKAIGWTSVVFVLGKSFSCAQALVSEALSPFFKPFKKNEFDGDNPDLPHEILWNKKEFLKSIGNPQKLPPVEILIVGGGISGLTAAYYLQKKQCLLLEQDKRVGGYSKGHINHDGTLRSIGAAYITIPEKGSPIAELLSDLGIKNDARIEQGSPVFRNHKFFHDFKDSLSSDDLKKYNQIQNRLGEIAEKSYPEIPFSDDQKQTELTLQLDKISFDQWLLKEFGQVPNSIKQFFQMYAWSSFNGSINEVSAAQFLNFVCGEHDGIMVFPGGNAYIADALLKKIRNNVTIQSGSFVADIKKTTDGFQTIFIQDRKAFVIESKKLIYSAPKFLLGKIFESGFEKILKSAKALQYRPYLVGQVDLNTEVELSGYDHFLIEEGFLQPPRPLNPPNIGFTDIIHADWARTGNNITKRLTVYKPLPYQGANQLLFAPEVFAKTQEQIKDQLVKLGFKATDISEIHLTRWGHSLPLAEVGLLASGKLNDLVNEEYQRQGMYLIGQDVYANPAFETAFETAYRVTQQLK